ncbi:MAG: family 16 glycoside hydrolase, partial [Planctomyces sp.]
MRCFFRQCVTAAMLLTVLLPTRPLSAQQPPVDAQVVAAENALRVLQGAAWQALFNGRDLTGWTGDVKGYAAENGVLVCNKGGKNLYTEKQYS